MESYRPDRDLSREDMGCNLWHISDLENLDGTRDMWRAYTDMRDANWIGADKYFHARGIYDANRRGPGGVWAAEVLRGSLQSGQVRLELFGKRQMRKHCLVLRLFQCRCLDEEDSFVFALGDEFR